MENLFLPKKEKKMQLKKEKPLLSFSKTLFMIAINFVFMMIFLAFFLKFTSSQKNDAQIINTTGGQRFLSQQIAKTSILYFHQWEEKQDVLEQELNHLLQKFSQNHQQLTHFFLQNTPKNPMKQLQEHYDLLVLGVKQLLSHDAKEKQEGFSKILNYEKDFLIKVNDITSNYAQESSQRNTFLRVFIIVNMFVLFLLFIFNAFKASSSIRKNQQYQKTINKKNQDLIETNLTKERLISIIAHDLRSPFTGILGFSKILIEDGDSIPPEEQKKFLTLIYSQTEHTLKLLEDLLEWVQLKQPQTEFSPRPIQFKTMIEEVLIGFSTVLQTKEVTIEIQAHPNLQITADLKMIQTILRNLISNAIKFSYPQQKIIVQAKEEQEEYRIAIIDFGAGMDTVTLNKLKKTGSYHSSLGTKGEVGTGLGLELCKELLEHHKGKLVIESKKDEGSTFLFTLPKI